MSIHDVTITPTSVKGIITVNIPFEIKAKRLGHRSVGFAGHTDYLDNNGKRIANAWPQSGGCRIYFEDKDDIVVNFEEDEGINEYTMLELLDFVKQSPEMQTIIEQFHEKAIKEEQEREYLRLEKKKQDELKELETLEKEIAALETQEKEL
jgi:hypothetical protein